MKLVKCIIPEDRLNQVKEALLKEGIQGLTAYPVQGFGFHRAQLDRKISRNYQVEFLPRFMLEMVLPDARVGEIVKIIMGAARTGHLGDGKVFILPVEDAVRLRTGERGDSVL